MYKTLPKQYPSITKLDASPIEGSQSITMISGVNLSAYSLATPRLSVYNSTPERSEPLTKNNTEDSLTKGTLETGSEEDLQSLTNFSVEEHLSAKPRRVRFQEVEW